MAALFSRPIRFSPQSDRTGLRLTGVRLLLRRKTSLVSYGFVRGSVQVPPSGEPILLSADAHAMGGYPVAAVVAQADLPLLAQIHPGEDFRFVRTSAREALEARAEREEWLSSVARFARDEGLWSILPRVHDALEAARSASAEELSIAFPGGRIRIARRF